MYHILTAIVRSVHVPGDLGERTNLPAVFWIHKYLPNFLTTILSVYLFARGGYGEGNASMYNGNDLIREAGGGVVAVVIQYRLGLLGFLPGEKVKEGGTLNAGLRKHLGSRQEGRTPDLML
jgi:Carboxylesterase family